ncbi:hypothetical protein BASA50_006528 [Batrachochytrium salamandrivorans]|uniref:Kinesin motor domain-containing protein n=1 Tax=Batrachochytrium salamandrivorans TaxID=1357716 RepID=A0ABQ8FA47_9FUNG|nr:hypothetical protein BASA50_006528 [Batrachochytrium salamandrivorans]
MVAAGSNPKATSTIKIYARVRPKRPNTKLHITPGRYWINTPTVLDAADPESCPRIGFLVPRDEHAGLINNQKESFEFKFDRLFDVDVKQEEVFDVVAKPVIESSLSGYNGTIFAYGQTGSGKTFTITGGAEKYVDRGLIPRTLQFLFKESQKNTNIQYTFHISYLEIYNEVGYDLLDSSRDAKKLEDLSKVTMQEDADEVVHLRNLNVVQASNEEEALNLLFVGDTNRMIAETPSNPSSSRSHCIFIIGITSRCSGEDVIRKSKLHLVDLAGSERVGRTGIEGSLLKEAKHINLSLHYLEQVIVALREHSLGRRTHIPYRNSMMTSVLRDSLGGNCKTTMIATIAVEDQLIDESISTCRFAQRVALISNNATLNEELDPQLVIQRLKREVALLKAELAVARGETGIDTNEKLPTYELERVKQTVDDYIADKSSDAAIIMTDFRKIQHAFSVFKSYIGDPRNTAVVNMNTPSSSTESNPAPPTPSKACVIDTQGLTDNQIQQFERLKTLVMHRDNEINILVGMIAQLKAQIETQGLPVELKRTLNRDTTDDHQSSPLAPSRLSTQTIVPSITVQHLEKTFDSKLDLSTSIPSLTTQKAKAFEIFRRDYPSSEWIDGQKGILKSKYTEAKALGELANRLRTDIKSLKERLAGSFKADADVLRMQLSDQVVNYKDAYQKLKDLKLEIEHIQHLLEQARHRLTRDFEYWYISVYMNAPNMLEKDMAHPMDAALGASEEGTLKSCGLLTAPAAGAIAHRTMAQSFVTDKVSASDDSTKSQIERTSGIQGAVAISLGGQTRQIQKPIERRLQSLSSSASTQPLTESISNESIVSRRYNDQQREFQIDSHTRTAWQSQNQQLARPYTSSGHSSSSGRGSADTESSPVDQQSIYTLEREGRHRSGHKMVGVTGWQGAPSRPSSRSGQGLVHHEHNSRTLLPENVSSNLTDRRRFNHGSPSSDLESYARPGSTLPLCQLYQTSTVPLMASNKMIVPNGGGLDVVMDGNSALHTELMNSQVQDDIAAFYNARQGVTAALQHQQQLLKQQQLLQQQQQLLQQQRYQPGAARSTTPLLRSATPSRSATYLHPTHGPQ